MPSAPTSLPMTKVLSHAPVTCVSLLPPTTSLVFRGGFATSYALSPPYAVTDVTLLFPDGRVHGISYREHASPSFPSSSPSSAKAEDDASPLRQPDLLSVVWGVRQVLLVHVISRSPSASLSPQASGRHYYCCRAASPVTKMPDLVHSGRIVRERERQGTNCTAAPPSSSSDCNGVESYVLCCAMANNSVSILSISSSSSSSPQSSLPSYVLLPSRLVLHPTRCLTYSLALHGPSVDELLVASGTVANCILLWTLESAERGTERDGERLTLRGHEGSIFDVAFHNFGPARKEGEKRTIDDCWPDVIASCSDDRSVRLWARLPTSPAPERGVLSTSLDSASYSSPPTFASLWVGWGHSARVWDLAFTSSHLLSSGEDGRVLVWELPGERGRDETLGMKGGGGGTTNTARPVAVLSGHAKASSVWRLSSSFSSAAEIGGNFIARDDGRVISGGNDGAAKVWDVPYFISTRSGAESAGIQHPVERRLYPPAAEELDAQSNAPIALEAESSSEASGPPGVPPARGSGAISVIAVKLFKAYGSAAVVAATSDGGVYLLEGEPAIGRWIVTGFNEEKWGEQTATTMEKHPERTLLAIGTNEGRVVVMDVRIDCEEVRLPHLAACFGVQCLHFLSCSRPSSSNNNDDKDDGYLSSVLFASHVNGVIICYDYKSRTILRVLTAQSRGGFVSCLTCSLWHENMLLAADSRGGVHLFSLDGSLVPASTFAVVDDASLASQPKLLSTSNLDRYHGRDIVSNIVCTGENRRTVYTIGHDGYFRTLAVVDNTLVPLLSQPIAYANSLTHLFISPVNKSLLIGGYRERTFTLWDVTSGFEILQFECGGWKRPSDLSLHLGKDGYPSFGYAFGALGSKTNPAPTIHIRGIPSPASLANFGVPFHGLPVYSIEAFPDAVTPNKVVLVTGSEDCTVKVTSFDKSTNSFTLLHDLPNSLSCVRSIASSTPRRTKAHSLYPSTLVVIGGGRLHLQFYEFIPSAVGPAVRFLCENDPPKHATIDHRINALVATPYDQSGRHVVIAGDSDGNISIIEVNVGSGRYRTLLEGLSGMPERRPILSLDFVTCEGNFVMVAGDTSGRIGIWSVTLADAGGMIATAKIIHVFSAHQCGANAISAAIIGSDLVVTSGGDDQALCVFRCTLAGTEFSSPSLTQLSNASSSALKSVAYFPEQSLLYAVGYDQRLTSWSVSFAGLRDSAATLEMVSQSVSSVADVAALCAIPDVSGKSMTVAVVGTGIELFKVELPSRVPESERSAVIDAAKALSACNFVLLTCGAGMSADSGLSTYENMASSYRELCDPLMMCTDYDKFAGFWEQTAKNYIETEPHEGYEVVSSWLKPKSGEIPVLRNLSSFYCYTSNVDGHIFRTSAFGDSTSEGGGGGVCEVHGRATDVWRCASKTGYTEDGVTERMGATWKAFNAGLAKSCKGNEVPGRKCSGCGGPTRPSVLLFNDCDQGLNSCICAQRDAYQAWEASMSDQVAEKRKKLVVLEIGCGLNVPAVRVEGVCVVLDLLRRLEVGRESDVVLIRVNMKDCGHVDGVDADLEDDDMKRFKLISVRGTAVEALKWIDDAMRQGDAA